MKCFTGKLHISSEEIPCLLLFLAKLLLLALVKKDFLVFEKGVQLLSHFLLFAAVFSLEYWTSMLFLFQMFLLPTLVVWASFIFIGSMFWQILFFVWTIIDFFLLKNVFPIFKFLILNFGDLFFSYWKRNPNLC